MEDVNTENNENLFYNFTNQSFVFQALTVALASFYRKTQLSAQVTYSYVPAEDSVMINLGFSPRVPTEEEFSILLEDIKISERFIIGNSFLSYTETLSDKEELDRLNEKFSQEVKISSIYLDIDMEVKNN